MSSSTQDRIALATLELLADHGFAGITMSAIAANAGVARQTLYNHYPDVESAVFAATRSHQNQSFEMLAAVLETIDSPRGRLEHLVRHTAALAEHGHPAIRGGFSSEIEQLIADHDAAVRDLVADMLRTGQESGEFRSDLDLDRDPLLIQRMIEAAGELVTARRDDSAAIVTATVRSVLAAVAAP